MTNYEELQKRCQRGATNLNDANNLLADCYGMLGKLGAENEALREDVEFAKRQPLYSTRRDAERYRWLRDNHIGDDPASINLDAASKPGLSAAIDAAMSKEG